MALLKASWWRPAGWLCLVAAGWTAYVWITRLYNLVGDDRSAAFIAVHVVVGVISLLLAIPVGLVGWAVVRGRRPGGSASS